MSGDATEAGGDVGCGMKMMVVGGEAVGAEH